MINLISSKQNAIIKQLRRLKDNSGKDGVFTLEGKRIVDECISSCAANIEYFVADSMDKARELEKVSDKPVYLVTDSLFAHVSDTMASQGVMCVVRKFEWEFSDNYRLLLVLDGVSDPGNLGTLIRTAECGFVDAVLLLNNCVSLYNNKVVRSTMGSILRLPVFDVDINFLQNLKGYTLLVTSPATNQSIFNTTIGEKAAIIIGSEAHGVSPEVMSLQNCEKVTIPMRSGCSSLNAAAAGAVCVYTIADRMGLL